MAPDLTRYRAELFLTLSSAYAAVQLLIFHHHFTDAPGRYVLLMRLESNEKFWAWFVTAAAAAKLLGIVISFASLGMQQASVYMRRAGLVGSAVFWFVLGLSYFIQFPYNVVSGPLVLMGGLSFWVLLRMPVDGYA